MEKRLNIVQKRLLDIHIDAYPNVASSLLISGQNQSSDHFYIDNPNRSRTGTPLIRFLMSLSEARNFLVRNQKRPDEILVNSKTPENHRQYETLSETYEMFIDGRFDWSGFGETRQCLNNRHL